MAAIFVSFGSVFVRILKDTPTPVIVFYHALLGTILASACIGTEVALHGTEALRFYSYSKRQMVIATGAAVLDTGALLCNNLAFQLGNASFVSLFTFLNIVYAFFIDVFFFEETFDNAVLIGSIVIVLVAIITAFFRIDS